jgi:hypothetical protein
MVYNRPMSTRTKAVKPGRKQTPATMNGAKQTVKRDLTPIPNHPLASLAGKYADDPAFAEMMEEVWKRRVRERIEDGNEG